MDLRRVNTDVGWVGFHPLVFLCLFYIFVSLAFVNWSQPENAPSLHHFFSRIQPGRKFGALVAEEDGRKTAAGQQPRYTLTTSVVGQSSQLTKIRFSTRKVPTRSENLSHTSVISRRLVLTPSFRQHMVASITLKMPYVPNLIVRLTRPSPAALPK
jgi:hypothetical protein